MPNSLVTSCKYELNNALDNIVALKDDVIPAEITFTLYAWPFSRNLVKAICVGKGYNNLNITRLNKDLESYSLTCDLNLESKLKQIIKLINRATKESKPSDLSIYRHRNFVTADALQEMFDFITPMQHSLQCQGKDIFEVDEVAEVAEVAELVEVDEVAEVAEVAELEAVDYNDMRASDLRPIAQKRKLPGGWKANRLDLIAMLQADDLKDKIK